MKFVLHSLQSNDGTDALHKVNNMRSYKGFPLEPSLDCIGNPSELISSFLPRDSFRVERGKQKTID